MNLFDYKYEKGYIVFQHILTKIRNDM